MPEPIPARAPLRRPAAPRSTPRAALAAFAAATALLIGALAPTPALAQTVPLEPLCEPPAKHDCRNASLAQGQAQIDAGYPEEAVHVFSCLIAADPFAVDAYRGRAEAELLLGRFADAFHEYALLTAAVIPVDPGAPDRILASYSSRLAERPEDVPALKGASFARWCLFDYTGAIPLLDQVLELRPDDVYANLFRGSTRLFIGDDPTSGESDLVRAVHLAPGSRDVRYILADAYTYALHDPVAAYPDAKRALDAGLDTPRVNAILASVHFAWGDPAGAAVHLERHIGAVTTDLVLTAPLAPGDAVTLELAPGRTYEVPVHAAAGQPITIETDNPEGEIADTILVLFAPDGSPVHGGDDEAGSLAALDWVAPETGTYEMWVTSFEAVGTGRLALSRD